MDETELLPCPFCGGAAHYYDDWHMEGMMSAISCEDCPAAVVETTSYNWKGVEGRLLEAWNKRLTA